MDMSNVITDGHSDAITLCPCCGSGEYGDNRIDESLYAAAAQEAPQLRFDGAIDDAVEVLSAWYAIKIANFIRPNLRCQTCGSQYDG